MQSRQAPDKLIDRTRLPDKGPNVGLNGMEDDQPKRDDQILPVFRPRPPPVQDAVVVERVVFLYGRAGEAARGGVIGEAGGQGRGGSFDLFLDLMFPGARLGGGR